MQLDNRPHRGCLRIGVGLPPGFSVLQGLPILYYNHLLDISFSGKESPAQIPKTIYLSLIEPEQ